MLPRSIKRRFAKARWRITPLCACALLGVFAIASPSQTQFVTQQLLRTQRPARSAATVHVNDLSQGTRVTIASNESLIDYEAYRQGDKFYVRIPITEVPRVETLRGHGFAVVTATKNGDRVLLCFTLQPGATAHVEQSGNRLDVLIALPGAGPLIIPASAQTTSPPIVRSDIPRFQNSNRGLKGRKPRQATASAANELSKAGAARVATKPSVTPAKSLSTPTPTAANSSLTPRSSTPTIASSTPPQKSSTPAAANTSPTPVAQSSSSQDWWSRMKERAHYWVLLAQLNPIPVGLGAGLLLLIIGLLLFQRRRARGPRRARPLKSKRNTVSVADTTTTSSVAPALATTAATEASVAPKVVAEKVAEVPAAAPAVVPVPVVAPTSSAADDPRRERVSRAAEEAKHLFNGESYDESIIGSEDREMRRLVGAELASALVGRSADRRERAREAFMKHGYFDDATRDLRTAESENERAAAARRLSFVQDREATPHLVGALSDPSPDVRRAAVEALMDLRDPAAIAPLHSLLQNESDRKVPRNLISQAIEACATTVPEPTKPAVAESMPSAVPEFVPSVPQPAPPSFETEREVIEL
jgi:HEAT repeat protein